MMKIFDFKSQKEAVNPFQNRHPNTPIEEQLPPVDIKPVKKKTILEPPVLLNFFSEEQQALPLETTITISLTDTKDPFYYPSDAIFQNPFTPSSTDIDELIRSKEKYINTFIVEEILNEIYDISYSTIKQRKSIIRNNKKQQKQQEESEEGYKWNNSHEEDSEEEEDDISDSDSDIDDEKKQMRKLLMFKRNPAIQTLKKMFETVHLRNNK